MNKKKIEIYKLKCINEDFCVTEVPLMPQVFFQTDCAYSYVWLKKSGFTTFDVIDQIKNYFGLEFNDVRSQGLKDEDAVTEQLISIKKILTEKDVLSFNEDGRFKGKFFYIKNIVGYGNDPIRERELHGNSFRIVIRDIEKNLAQKVSDYILSNRYLYFINYYDSQRFGMPGGPYNTHLIGKSVVENDWKKAYEYALESNNFPPEFKKINKNNDPESAFKTMNPKKIAFFVAAYNSFLWNNEASSVVKEGVDGNSYFFENVGKLFLPSEKMFKCSLVCETEGYEFNSESFCSQPKKYERSLVIGTTIYVNSLEDGG